MPDTEVEPYPQDLALHIGNHEDAVSVRERCAWDAITLVDDELDFAILASLSRANQQAVIDAANRHARSLCYEEETVTVARGAWPDFIPDEEPANAE